MGYYTGHSPITDPGEFAGLFADLPCTIEGLRQVVSGLLANYMGMEPEEISGERLSEIDTRYVAKMLARIIELDDRPLNEPRSLERRLLGCCRDAAVLFCAMARHQGIPTRTRVGFAAYLPESGPDFNVSHEIAECWDLSERRWRLVDPDLGDPTIEQNNLPVNPHDVSRDQFLVGGKAWQMCRAGGADPNNFGVGDRKRDRKGLWLVRVNLILDLAAQNKMEMLLWDGWGSMSIEPTDGELATLDRAAVLTQAGDEAFSEMRAFYEATLRVPTTVTCYSPVAGPSEVTLAT
jgi:hypothetical protein